MYSEKLNRVIEESLRGLTSSGYESEDMIENLETLYVVLFIGVALLSLIPVLHILSVIITPLKRLQTWITNFLFWNGIWRFLVEVNLEMSINCMLNLVFINLQAQWFPAHFNIHQNVSLAVTYCFTAIYLVLPMISYCYLSRNLDYI